MAQNTSSAVMQQRIEPHDSLDFFPTPAWATRALCEVLIDRLGELRGPVWEPACGDGSMARPLGEYFSTVHASDVHEYGFGEVRDFLIPMEGEPDANWIITNPPFRLAEQFVERALSVAWTGCAMLVRTSFLEGVGRHERLFRSRPPAYVLQFAERVPMFKGRLDPTGSTATSYCWIVWVSGYPGTEMHWIAPCRRSLERPGDYPEAAA